MRLALAAVLAAILYLGLSGTAHAGQFGRLFTGLPPLNSQTNQQLADLAQTQLDPNADSENNCERPAISGPTCTTSGFTYFGQFVDHDMTLDTSASPLARVDPTRLTNSRTLRFDLDSVYGGGPAVSPQLYEADRLHFRTQNPNPNGVPDLPRNPDGSAILVEGRNDENQILSQLHNAFLRAHNRLIDEGKTFAAAQQELIRTYQRIVLNDFLPHITGSFDRTKGVKDVEKRLKKETPDATMVEFSVAAYRFGHSQVRLAYVVNDNDADGQNKIQVFNLTGPDLRGGRQLGADRSLIWGYFFGGLDESDDLANVNVGRRIDPLISRSLFALPIPGAEATGSNVLAFRNMIRAKFYDMPSGEAVAGALGLPVVGSPVFPEGTPLWYYILREAALTRDGRVLGPVGSAIVRDTFEAVLFADQTSILRAGSGFRPSAEMTGDDGVLNASDLLVFAGLTERAS
jgi:hypothetical protein